MAFYKYTEYKPRSEGGPIRTSASWWLASRTTKVPWQWCNNEWLWEIDEDVYDWLALVAWKEIDANYWQASIVEQLFEQIPALGRTTGCQKEGEEEEDLGIKKNLVEYVHWMKRNQTEWNNVNNCLIKLRGGDYCSKDR